MGGGGSNNKNVESNPKLTPEQEEWKAKEANERAKLDRAAEQQRQMD